MVEEGEECTECMVPNPCTRCGTMEEDTNHQCGITEDTSRQCGTEEDKNKCGTGEGCGMEEDTSPSHNGNP